MARTKLTCRKPQKRKFTRLDAFIAAYEQLYKSDIKPHSRFTALKSMMKKVKRSHEKELRHHRREVDR